MNYRHVYHAGNFADVIKHVILVALLERLGQKDKGFCYMDTHAGVGVYDLFSESAQKTAEYLSGVGRLLEAADLGGPVARYLELVRSLNEGSELRQYPGSPELARLLLRPQDRAALFELHPADAAALKQRYRRSHQIAVHAADGYRAVRSLLPPPLGRGLMLVDPPFERDGEFERMLDLLLAAHKVWRGGVLAFWYPLKDDAATQGFHRRLIGSGVRKILRVEVEVRPRTAPPVLYGSGMAIVNPPWDLAAQLHQVLPPLAAVLANGAGRARVDYLVPE